MCAYDPCGREFVEIAFSNLEDLPTETKQDKAKKRMVKSMLKQCDCDSDMFIKLSEMLERKPELMDDNLFARITRCVTQ